MWKLYTEDLIVQPGFDPIYHRISAENSLHIRKFIERKREREREMHSFPRSASKRTRRIN